MADKITYIQTSEHAIIGESGAQAAVLAPGEEVLFNEEADSHKYIKWAIEARDKSVAHLSLVEKDPDEVAAAEAEQEEMLEKAEKIASEARAEEARAAQDRLADQLDVAEEQQPHPDPTDFPKDDVEAQRLAKKSGGGQRASTQEDVVEDKARSSRKGSKD